MATKIIYLNGFGYMEVPAGLSGRELAEYATAKARESSIALSAAAPQKEEAKPDVSIPMQALAGVAAVPAGLVSSLAGGTLQGIGGLLAPIGGRPIEEAGTAIRKGIDEYLADLVGKEAAESTGAQVGKTVGNIASFFTPGAALKAVGALGKGSAALRALATSNAVRTGSAMAMSGLQGAGEQVERIRQQEAEGKQISDLERAALAGGAGILSAGLEYAPELIASGSAFLPRVAGKIAEAAPIARTVEAENLAKAFAISPSEIAKRFGKSFISEGSVEAAQEAAQNLLEKAYNPERGLLEGTLEAGIVGGVAGGVLEGGIDLWKGHKIRQALASGNEKALRDQLEAPSIPEAVKTTTLFIRDLNNQMETALQEGDIEKAGRIKKQKDALEADVKRLSVNLLPAPKPPLEPIEYPGTAETLSAASEQQRKRNVEAGAMYKASRFPTLPSAVPDPTVVPMDEWSGAQRTAFTEYIGSLPKEQSDLFESLTEEEAPTFVSSLVSQRQNQEAKMESEERERQSQLEQEERGKNLALVNQRIDDAKQIAKYMGYPPPARMAVEDRAALAGLIQEQDRVNAEGLAKTNEEVRQRFDQFMKDRSSALQKIDQNFGLASDLARSEFNKELGKLNDRQKITLSELIDVSLSERQDKINRAAGEAQAQTELNKQYGRVAEEDYRKAYRLAQDMFSKPYEGLSAKEQGVVWDAIRSGEGKVVTPQEILEREEFAKKPHSTEEYREVQSAVKEAGDNPVTIDYILQNVGQATPTASPIVGRDESLKSRMQEATKAVGKQKPVASTMSRSKAKSIMQHMIERGDLVSVEGDLYYNDKATGPKYEIEESVTPETKTEETAPLVATEDNSPQQQQFNEEYARQLAPDVYAHLKSRNAGDLFIAGLVNQIKTGEGTAPGSYLNRVINLAMMNKEGGKVSRDNMLSTMDHEIIHGMRELGLFTDNEWKMLTNRFNADTLNEKDRKRYEEIYQKQGLNPAQITDRLNEEAVAKAVKDIKDVDPKRLDSSSLSMLNKVNFFLDFGRVSSVLGYNSAEDVLAAVKSGDIGKRKYAPAFEKTDKGIQALAGQRKITPRVLQTAKPTVAASSISEAPGSIKPTGTGIEKPAPDKKGAGKKKPSKEKAAKPKAAKMDIGESGEEAPSEQPKAKSFMQAEPESSDFFETAPEKKSFLAEALGMLSGGNRKFSMFRQKVVDRYDPVHVMMIEAYGKTGDERLLSAAEGSYHSLLFSDKAADTALAILDKGGAKIKQGIILATENEESSPMKIFQGLHEAGRLQDFFNFAYAKRYKYIKDQLGKDPGGTVSEDKVNAVYEKFKDDPLIDKAITGFKKYNDNLVNILMSSGFISAADGAKWKQGFYIPFYRIPTIKYAGTDEETGEVDLPKLSSQIANLSAPKGLTGRELPVNDAIQNIIANTHYIIGTAAKNIAAQRVARDGVITDYMRRIEKPKDAEQGAKVITVRFKGEKAYYEVKDPMLYDAVAKSGFPVQDVLKAAGWFTEKLRRGTTLFPTFIIKNPIRDLTQTWALGGFGKDFLPPVAEYAKSITSAARKSPTFEVLRSAGLASSGLRKKTIQETATEFRKQLGQEQGNALSRLFDAVTGSLEKAADKSEAYTRELAFDETMKRTGDQAEALFAAMETMNFSRKGNSRGLQVAMALVPFFNARIQGIDIFYRTLSGNRIVPSQMGVEARNRAVTRMMYLMFLSGIYAMLMSDNETYMNATDEEKDNNLFIPIDFIPGVKEGSAIKFPIPPEIGIVSKLIPERLVTHYKGKTDTADEWAAAKRAVMDTLSFNPIAQFILPYAEVAANFDVYTQKPIENAYLKSLLPEERYTEYTTGTAKAASDALAKLGFGNLSPVQVDHLIRGYFGTSGAFMAEAAGQLYEMGEKVPQPERMRFSEPYLLPVIGRLFKSQDGRKAVEDMYAIDEAATMAVATLKLYSEGQRALSDEKVQQLEELASIKAEVQPAVIRVRDLNRMKRSVQADPDMSPKEKRDELNEINREIIEVSKDIQDLKKQIPFRLR